MSRSGEEQGRPNRILAATEWIVAACGATFLFFAIGYMAWYAVAHENGQPAISTHVVSLSRAGEHHAALFQVRNEGDATAAGLVVEGQLRRGDETIEEAETTIDYVPGRSKREGALLFSNDPTAFRIVLSARGYHKP